MTTTVRLGVERDLDDALQVERLAFGEAAWSASMLSGALRAHPQLFFVAQDSEGEALIGHAIGQLAGDVGEVLEIGVVPSARRRGVGGLLLAELERALERGGAAELWLEVRADNTAARALYERRGYAVTGRRPRYYADGVDALLMARPAAGPR